MEKIILIILISFLTASCSLAEEGVTRVSLIKEKSRAEDAKSKIDKAIAVMNVIKNDIDDLDREGLLEEEGTQPEPKSWGENVKDNIDKLEKILKIIKEDVNDLEKIETETNYEPKRRAE